ncbi:MAG: HEPN domain-containing protein [Bacteroidales bacterium]|nr:HEPN domain-containing protein [Bacteroidales bacterium]
MDSVVQQYIKKLDSIISDADKIDKDNVELRSHMAKYICIRVSGLMETFFKRQLANYLQGSTPKPVENYVNSRFKSFTSVNCKKITDTLGLFSDEWVRMFDENLTEPMRTSLDSIVANRHNLAHGKDQGLTLIQVKEYYSNVKDVIALLEKIVTKQNSKRK